MSSRKYRNLKFLYSTDLNQDLIKNQRVYLDESGEDITPVTPLFLSKVLSFPEKIISSSANLRRIEAYIGTGKFIIKVPFSPLDNNILAQIEEVLKLDRVLCADYKGDNFN